MESKPNLNLSLKIHEARIDSSISDLSLSSQIALTYNGVSIRTKTSSDHVWEESFNFEFSAHSCEIVLVHNPMIFKEIIIGKNIIQINSGSWWFDLRNQFGKIGSVRISMNVDPTENILDQECSIKLNQLLIYQDEINRCKQRYVKRLEKLKHKRRKNATGASILELCKNHSNNIKFSAAKEGGLLKEIECQEENITKENNIIEISWKEIENERNKVKELRSKIQTEFDGLKRHKERLSALTGHPSEGKLLQVSNISYLNTPVSMKRTSKLSELSFTQPRNLNKSANEEILKTPTCKLLKF